jgi:hypothetical protein
MAPMMTAAESLTRPKVAMVHERTTSKKKSKPGAEVRSNSSRTSAQRFAWSGCGHRRNKRISMRKPS